MPSVDIVYLYKVPHVGLGVGAKPLIVNGGDISSYLVRSIANVKHSKNIQQQIRLPYFSEYDDVNMLRIGDDWYWITAYQEVADGTILVTLDYEPVTSLLRYNGSVYGQWERVPTRQDINLKESVSELPSDAWFFALEGRLRTPTVAQGQVLYCQVTGFTSANVLKVMGCFISCDDEGDPLGQPNLYYDASTMYPSFDDLIEHMAACTGIEAERVIDMSVSPFCPWELYDDSGTTEYLRIYPSTTPEYSSAYGKMYDLSAHAAAVSSLKTTTVDLGAYGIDPEIVDVSIANPDRSDIMKVLHRSCYAETASGYSVTVGYQTISDLSGIYTVIYHDPSATYGPAAIHTWCKTPYLSNSWETYAAFSMEGDRTQMENSIRYAKEQADIDKQNAMGNMVAGIGSSIASGAMTAAFSGPAAIAGAIGSAVGTAAGTYVNMQAIDRKRDLEVMQARDSQALNEINAVNALQNVYQSSYGTLQIHNQRAYPLSLCIRIPYSGRTGSNVLPYTGYRAYKGRSGTRLTEGYIRGRLIPLSADYNFGTVGMKFDELEKAFSNGFRISKMGM